MIEPGRRDAVQDLTLAVVCAVIAVALTYVFKLGEAWHGWAQAHEGWEIDEIPMAVALTAAAGVWYSIRQWQSMRQQYRNSQRLLAKLEATVTAQKQTEEALRASETRFVEFLENLPFSVVVKDLNGAFILVNRAFLKCYDLAKEQVIGRTDHDILAREEADAFDRQDSEVRDSGKQKTRELDVTFADGQTHIVSVTKFPIYDAQGKITAIGSVGLDITDRKQAEERLAQAQKMETVGQLTGGVAHDFNNLLAVVRGTVELLELQCSDDVKELLAPIQRATQRGAELTQRLLAFSRRQSLAPQPFNVARRIDGMLVLLKRTLGETIRITTDMDADLWPVLADPGQVENAVLNLSINARDAMPNGGPLAIRCRNERIGDGERHDGLELEPGDYVVISVIDAGTGMTAEVIERAFEPFFTTKEVGKGSGLGLSMVYGFAKQSGGQAAIESEIGKGTTVKLYLPRAATVEDPKAETVGDLPHGKGEAVMVIEDDDDVRDLAACMLESLGYKVQAAASTDDALPMVDKAKHLDVLLSDVVLPGAMSGPAFAIKATRRHPRMKVIFMSGYATDAPQAAALRETGAHLLHKPFQMQELAQALRAALD